MHNNPALWSSIGFWILIAGLVGDVLVIALIPSGRLEKMLAIFCTLVVIAGVAIEHISDSKRFGPRVLSPKQQAEIAASLKPLSLMPDPGGAERVDVVVFPITTEAVVLSNQIVASLKAATWGADIGQENGAFFGVAVSGVAVFVHGIDSLKGTICAKRLTEELNAKGIVTQFAGPAPKWRSCTALGMADKVKTDPACAMLLVIVGDHP